MKLYDMQAQRTRRAVSGVMLSVTVSKYRIENGGFNRKEAAVDTYHAGASASSLVVGAAPIQIRAAIVRGVVSCLSHLPTAEAKILGESIADELGYMSKVPA